MHSMLVLSPHFDDAVLSCGGTILRTVSEGGRVVVATVCTRGPGDELHYSRRAEEDRRALDLLGASPVELAFCDAPYRIARYRSFETIGFDWGEEDERIVPEVRAAIGDLCARFAPERILAPLAIGGHVDHRIVFRAVRELALEGARYYEDRPYHFVSGVSGARFAELGLAAPPDMETSRAELARGLDTVPFVRRFVRDAAERDRIEELFWQKISGGRAQLGATAEVTVLREEEVDALVTAVGCYASQIAAVVGSVAQFRAAIIDCGIRIGAAAVAVERQWRHP